MKKKQIYFIPGLAANSLIFEKINLPNDLFEVHFIEWKEPLENESLSNYSERIIQEIHHKNPILIGVSFGGIIAQEIAKKIKTEKIIIISSVKKPEEYPFLYKIAKKLKLYIFPIETILNCIFNTYKKTVTSKNKKEKLKLYDKYLSIRSNNYLNWGIKTVLNWENKNPLNNIIHIHGTKDEIFPAKNIKNAILLPQANHALILTRYKWLNENLPTLILKEGNEKN